MCYNNNNFIYVSVRFSIAANWGHLFHNSNLFCEEIKHFKRYEIRLVTKKLKNNDVYSIRSMEQFSIQCLKPKLNQLEYSAGNRKSW